MKFIWLIVFLLHQASLSTDACEKSFGLMSKIEPEKINILNKFKHKNHGSWVLAGQHSGFDFVLEPKKITTSRLQWKVLQFGKLDPNLQDGELNCETPLTWQLKPKKTLHIIYPQTAHGLQENTATHSLSTFAGIYLGKSIYKGFPDIIRIMWHLNQTRIPEEAGPRIIASYPFIGAQNLSILGNTLDKNNEVQLIALHFSQARELDKGEQLWLVTDAKDQDAIRKSAYKTPESKHNGWLPWLDPNRPEFKASSLVELYETTSVAPIGITKIYDRSTGSYIPDSFSVPGKMQYVYDIIAPLVRARMDNNKPLFTHLLLQSKNGYELFSFEILENGTIEPLSNEELQDPSWIGLPSAVELGFAPMLTSDMNIINFKARS